MPNIRVVTLAAVLSISAPPIAAEDNTSSLPVQPHNVSVRDVGGHVLEVRLVGPYRGPDTDTFAFVSGLDFHDGTTEVDVAGAPAPSRCTTSRSRIHRDCVPYR
jgi:hypothetical protein